MHIGKRVFALVLCVLFVPVCVMAQQADRIREGERKADEEKLLRERVEKEKKPELRIEEEIQVEGLPVNAQQKVFVKKVNVTNATLLTQQEIADIIVPFENQELTLAQMQKAVAMITDAYRRRGYVTSRATLPPQKIVDGVLEILIVEGTTGDIQVKGNKFFRSELIRNAVHLQKGRLFNYNDLRKDLQRLNEKPDRTVKAVLVPGKEPGSTDIILEVSDRLPVHFRTEWDNYGSRYVRKERFTESVRHNNLLGFDDMLYLQAQSGESQDYMLFAMQYIIPVADRTKIGFAASDSKVDLGEEYADLNARGKSKMFELFAVQELYMSDDLRVNANAGFDYLDSFSFQLGSEQSRDRLRTLKLGFDADYSDAWDGRTIISPESSFGLGSIMAGLKDKDSRASRSGAGGKYIKHSMNLLRFQRLPHQLAFLWKNQAQVSPYALPAAQQIQLGGISNVRGYPSAELVGDKGLTSTFELLAPVYGLPKDIGVFLSKAKLYDALRLVAFYDWGCMKLKNPGAGESKRDTLRSAGIGLRLNLPENFSLRADLAWPLDRTPSDGNHVHPWMAVSKEF